MSSTAGDNHTLAISRSTSSFGAALYKRLASGNQDNIIYSPISVYTALAMTFLGSGGVTERELRRALAVSPGQNLHSDLLNLFPSFVANDPDANLTLRIANALYYDAAEVNLTDSYVANVNQYYQTGLRAFQRPNPEQAINTWVEEVTKRAITNFLQPGSIQSDTVIMLLNAVFFEAPWVTPFRSDVTMDKDFTTISGTVKQVPLMYQISSFSVKNVPELDARVLELPYKGGNYSLYIILPNTKTGLTEVESQLTGQILEEALTSMPVPQYRQVYIPKFSLRMRSDLKEPLEALGINAMFDISRANLTGDAVSKVLHEAMIEVPPDGSQTWCGGDRTMVNTGLRAALTVLLCLAVTTASPRHRRASSLSLSTSSFGTSLYKRLVSGNHDNIIYSPLSVYTALTMTLLGAGGVTERELMTTLAVQPGQNIHSDLHTLMTSLTTNDPASNLTLRMANALYYDAAQVKVTDGFADNINRYYGAALKPFQKPNPEEAINTWVEEVTKHAITNFLQPGYITGDVILMLLNAVFFEASWKTMFDPRVTHDADFTTISGAVKQVPLMSKDESFSVKNVPELDARVLELPYKGGDYSLFVILPNTKNGLTNMEDKLTGQVLESALSSMPHAIPRKVYLPKFTLRMRKGLNEPLKALGLNAMFEAGRANFSEMVAGGGIFVSDTLHEAMIEVTESGTKAAAVTSITFSRNLILPDPETLFKADHAFAFVLRDKANGVNLFMGRVADPQ
ncbi:hypothetical protein C0Q70_20971 [Pomacea canaliculata]|uniref:Serpin domain-containing protein n=2 Tax=Pomacea canaliculata TaxID=400727 RepID=A0A2T7NB98_POMCA|nr:hypothetical protein C0Q70_20971 [Pomacea canaliculata]